MYKLGLSLITIVTAVISLNSLFKLYTERERLSKEDLNDYDLALIWRTVIFVLYPLFNLLAFWTSINVCQWCGGYVRSAEYGLLWYRVVPDELASRIYLMPTLFAGEIMQIFLVIVFLLALLFRPHPFLAMLLTYSCSFVLAINLIVDPILSIFGLGSSHWQMAINNGTRTELIIVSSIHLVLAVLFLVLLNNKTIRMLFAELTRPIAVENLKQALAENNKNDLASVCSLIMLQEKAGFSRTANKQLKELKKSHGDSLIINFTEAYLSYRRRDFKKALSLFSLAADSSPDVSDELKGMLLAAASCCANANQDLVRTLSLADRALEIDQNCLMARMMKIDVLSKQGKESQVAEEFQRILAVHSAKDLEQTIPIDWQYAFNLITKIETSH